MRILGLLAFVTCGAAFLACAVTPDSPLRKGDSSEDGIFNDDIPEDPPPIVSNTNDDGGAFDLGSRPKPPEDAGATPSSEDGASPPANDAAVIGDAGSLDAGPVVLCEGDPKPGDLVVTELLIASRSGSNDNGEWVEITSTRSCTLSLRNVVVASPRGTTGSDAVTIASLDLPPGGSFIVAGSTSAVTAQKLPGSTYAWNAADVLKNSGDTVSITVGAVTIDSVTYPSFGNLEPGRSAAFPADCPSNVRTDWKRWSFSFNEWIPGMKGTPNAANGDVACY